MYGTPGKNEKRILKHPKWLLNLLNVYQSILGGHGQIHVYRGTNRYGFVVYEIEI